MWVRPTLPRTTPTGPSLNLGECKNGRRLKVVVLNADPQFVVTVADRDDQR